MIKTGEIQNIARELGVRDQQIEKDYILSWILQGISQHIVLSTKIVFKGGTVLKKVYFNDYRFSEDLDFTLLASDISDEQMFEWFNELFEYIRNEANIPLKIIEDKELEVAHLDDMRRGINFYINYIGPLGGLGANKKVKIDISRNERIIFQPIIKQIFLDYSDQEVHQLLCYSLEEVLIEKMRSVIQWMQARDFYDIWYLLEIHGLEVDFYIEEFKIKCESKNIDPADFHNKLVQRMPQYRGRWKSSMSDQIQELSDFDEVARVVLRHLKKV